MEKLSQEKWLASEQRVLNFKIDRKSFVKLMTYRGITLWWFVRLRLYGSPASSGLINSLTKSTRLVSFTDFLYDLFTSILCKVLLRHPRAKTGRKRQLKVLITAQNVEWRNMRDLTGRLKKGDAFFDSVIVSLKKLDYDIVTVYPLDYSISGLKTMVDKLKGQKGVVHKAFNIYWSVKIWKNAYDARKYFRDIWANILEKDEKFIDLLDRYGHRTKLSYYFSSGFERVVKNVEMAKELIEEEEPDLILLVNEYGVFERALLVAGKLKGIPTVAIQHGIITPTHYGYMFGKEDKERVVLPDVTCVYGQYHYDLLTKNSIYEPEQVVVTGQPRYDILHHADKIYSEKKILEKYKTNPSHRVLLWTTQCHYLSDEENTKNFKTMFETMQNIQNVTLLIKQHPGEGKRHTKMIEDVLTNYKIDAMIAPRGSDTYEQLFVCDLLITKSSTTAMEAVALNKPVIVLNLGGEADEVDYVEQGVAIGVYKAGDLRPSVEKLLKGDLELAKNRERYTEKYLYKIDGKATERVVKLIEAIMTERKKDGT